LIILQYRWWVGLAIYIEKKGGIKMTKEERRKYMREYYARNRERILAEKKELYATDKEYKEKTLENANQWYNDNKERYKKNKKEYFKRKDIKERISEYNASYYVKNKKEITKKRKEKREEIKTVGKGGVIYEV
jgi:hypothetical protein